MATTPQRPVSTSSPPALKADPSGNLAPEHERDPRRPGEGHRVDREAAREERRHAMEDAPPQLNEQMQRSREIETMGVEAWKASQDQRPIEEQPVLVKDALPIGDVLNTPPDVGRRVPGISHPVTETPQRAPVRNPDGSLPRA
jgi:hypothetical protein